MFGECENCEAEARLTTVVDRRNPNICADVCPACLPEYLSEGFEVEAL